MANIIGTNANDTLVGTDSADTINGKAGNDTIAASDGNDTLTGGGGKDTFIYDFNYDNIVTITDFGGVGKGTNPTPAVIAEVDTIKFEGSSARNMVLTQNGNNLEITFEGLSIVTPYTKVILQNFKLEDLDNLKASGTRPAIGNVLFDGETSITDSFNVLDANSTDTSIGIKNTVTFLNDLDNNITGLDNSDDVVNGQGGNDKIDGLSGDDLLRGGAGNDTLIGGVGNDNLVDITGNNSLVGGIGDDILDVDSSTGKNTLDGGADDDTLIALGSQGNNLLFGGDGNDYLDTGEFPNLNGTVASLGNNTLNGGAGNDRLRADSPKGNNLLSGDNGDDYLSVSGSSGFRRTSYYDDFEFSPSGDNTLNGGAGNDTLLAKYSAGDNLLSGDDGNDYLSISGYVISFSGGDIFYPSTGNNTLNGGTGNDTLDVTDSIGNNLLSGGDGNDSFSVDNGSKDTIDGGKGDDLLSVDYSNANGGITSTFNATTNTGSITAATEDRVSYKNIERLNIIGTAYDDNIVGTNGNDTLFAGTGGKDTIDGGKGDDLLSVDYRNATGGISSTFNAATNTGSITAGMYRVSYKNIERLNITGTNYNDNIVGNNGNDTLSGGYGGKDTIDGGKGDDLLSVDYRNATGGITSTFNAATNTGEITAGTYGVSYKNIEQLNIIGGTIYNDNIVGSNGNDTLSMDISAKDTVDGGQGNDLLYVYGDPFQGITSTFNATTNTGEITAGTYGVSYKNIEQLNITGTDYDDYIVGSNGNDTLSGGYIGGGNDTLIGGAGNDTFILDLLSGSVDKISDFSTTNDLIQVSAFGDSSLLPGVLKANQFAIGTSATTTSQRLIYDASTGALLYDADGSANQYTQFQFGQLSAGLSLTNNNFVVV
ncbi:MAG: calcium-binding protein [Nostoc sp.]